MLIKAEHFVGDTLKQEGRVCNKLKLQQQNMRKITHTSWSLAEVY
jgi:hypothetical protein